MERREKKNRLFRSGSIRAVLLGGCSKSIVPKTFLPVPTSGLKISVVTL
jgi:hypothetical protein